MDFAVSVPGPLQAPFHSLHATILCCSLANPFAKYAVAEISPFANQRLICGLIKRFFRAIGTRKGMGRFGQITATAVSDVALALAGEGF